MNIIVIRALAIGSIFAASFAIAQVAFESGSDGSDGELRFIKPPPARGDHAVVFHEDAGHALLYGGSISFGAELGDSWIFSGGEWAPASPTRFPPPREDVAIAYDSTRKVVVMFGGFHGTDNDETNQTWEWDGSNWTRKYPTTSPGVRLGAAMAYDSVRQEVVMFGGSNDSNELNDTWTYNGTNWTQKFPAGATPEARLFHGMAFDSANSQIVLFGGTNNGASSGALADTWTYNGFTWTEVVTDGPGTGFDNEGDADTSEPFTRQRYNFGIAYHQTLSAVVIFSGVDGRGQYDHDLWKFDGTTWDRIDVGETAPAPAENTEIAYDPVADRLIYFGGYNGAYLNETWFFDGTAWTAPATLQPKPVLSLTDPENAPRSTFHYTDIIVPEGVTVTFERNATNTPVYWLASGDVTIGGVIDVSGEDGTANHAPGGEAKGGPGGFDGGLGGENTSTGNGNPFGTPGIGPGGGSPSSTNTRAGDAGYGTKDPDNLDGQIYGNPQIAPLVGGSGGGGGGSTAGSNGGGGGGGGGAIFIAASGTMTINGTITADGGKDNATGGDGGNGSGGAIKLMASRITGNGILSAKEGDASTVDSLGRIRMESFDNTYTGSTSPPLSAGHPSSLNALAFINAQPTIRITSIAGQAVDENGSFATPEVAFSSTTPVTIEFETSNVPQGLPLNLRITTTGDQRGSVIPATTSAVAADGTTSASVVLPAGIGSIQATANFAAQ